jgi:Tetratricopeptide repeat
MDYRIEQLRYLLREDPSSRIFYQLGELLRREGEAAQAVEVLRSGLDRHPRYVAAWVSLGRSQKDLRALEEAKAAFESALELDRENPVAARLLGETAVEREDWLGAVKALKLSRALSGADEGLDAQIAMVEAELDEGGRLERPFGQPRPVAPPVRCLDVVNLSADDPFSSSSEDAEARVVTDDVFATVDAVPEAVVDEITDEITDEVTAESEAAFGLEAAAAEAPETTAETDIDVTDEYAGDESLEIEEGLTAEVSEPEPDGAEADEEEAPPAEIEIVDEPIEIPTREAPMVDESSVGAWSTSTSGAGVSGEEAWAEPGDQIVNDDVSSGDDPWAEPSAALGAVETPEDEVLDAVDVIETVAAAADEELPPEDDQTEPEFDAEVEAEAEPATEPELEVPTEIDERSDDAAIAVAGEVEDFEATDEVVPPVETHEFDSIEITHPVVVEKRKTAADEQAESSVDEQPTPDAAAREAFEATFDGEVLPGEDRGFDAIEVTRPIPLPGFPGAEDIEITPEPTGAETMPPLTEVDDEGSFGDHIETTDRRHELDHGVPLPTMTLAKLALQQDDRPLAMATLESLIERDPTHAEAIAMLDELSEQEATSANEKLRAARATTKIAALQGWLDAVRLAAERRVQ